MAHLRETAEGYTSNTLRQGLGHRTGGSGSVSMAHGSSLSGEMRDGHK